MIESHRLYSRFAEAPSSVEMEHFARSLMLAERDLLLETAESALQHANPQDSVAIRQRLSDFARFDPHLSPLEIGIREFLNAETDQEVQIVLESKSDLLLSEASCHLLEAFDPTDSEAVQTLSSRRRLWRQVYQSHSRRIARSLTKHL